MGSADQRRRFGVITNREIANFAGEWQLAHQVVEKDYVLGWLLAAIAEHPQTRSWAFKGGTCLRKCWFETYRFSEDLDFTVAESDLDVGRLGETFAEIASWLDDRCGLRLIVDDGSFRRRQNKRGKPTIEGRLGYLGPLGMPTPPKVKLDLTADEVIVRRLDLRPVMHPFSDAPSSPAAGHLAHVVCYSLPELLGEKIRALAERCRPRDLYDVVHTHRHPDLAGPRRRRRSGPSGEVCPRTHRHADPCHDPLYPVPRRDRDRVVEHARPPAAPPAQLRRLLVPTRRRVRLAGRKPTAALS